MSPEEMFSTIRLVRMQSRMQCRDHLDVGAAGAEQLQDYQRLCMRTKLMILDISLGDIEGACQIGFRDMEGQPTNPGSFWLVGFVTPVNLL